VLLVLTNNIDYYQRLIEPLQTPKQLITVFETVPDIQKWLEVNHEPTGLIVDCSNTVFEAFLVRFTLQHTDTPTLLLQKRPFEKLQAKLTDFVNNIRLREKPKWHARILFVDDSKTVQVSYRRVLESDGFKVDLANNAEQGYEMALAKHYDLAIIDYYMPGDSGAELCRKLGAQDETSELVRAILTAQYDQKIVDECLNAGARECMFKNESTDLFLARIRALYRSVQRKLQVDKERTRLIGLLHSVPEGVYGVTPDGYIQFVNPSTIKLLGRSAIELLGRRPHDCIHPVDTGGKPTTEDLCFLQQAYMLEDELREWRTLFSHSDGSLFPVECNVTPLGGAGTKEGSVVVFRDISEQQRLEKNWQWQLSHDHLTGLLNRSAFEEVMERELNNLKRLKDPSLLLFIDLDKFKLFNDELGHAAGDQLLVILAEQLKSNARATDQLTRLAGDEFAVLLSGIKTDDIGELAEKYRKLFEQTNLDWEGKQYQVTGSIGATLLDKDSGSLIEMLAEADAACQQAKQKGRNQWVLYQEGIAEPRLEGNWHKRLASGIKDNLFVLFQQAIVSAENIETVVGCECLSRLEEGISLSTPSLFMSNASRCGVTPDIDQIMLQLLIDQCLQRKPDIKSWFSINLSIETISDDLFRETLLEKWHCSGQPASNLMIEVSETDLFKVAKWKKYLLELKNAGFQIALDHFGMNMNSILNLSQFPIDMIKLDTTLTRTLATDLARRNLIDAIVATAKHNDIKVIACNVETASELDLVQARGVDYVQGFYLGKPYRLDD
jgi:diguanylate cyclase (GGDEF)-like protein/PAS domain S-box-containing protein